MSAVPRDTVTVALDVLGLAAISAGGFVIAVWLGLIVIGLRHDPPHSTGRRSWPLRTRGSSRCWTGWAKAAEGRDDLRAEVAGRLAGLWFARPESQLGHELVAAGLLILAGVTDRGEAGRWVRIGYERGHGSLEGVKCRRTHETRPRALE
jgi:hypothetical protein